MVERWERQENEPTLWYERFLVFLRLGPSRKLLTAVHEAEKGRKKQSSCVPGSWNDAFRDWQWIERATAYDDYRRKEVFTSGNAYDVNRVEKLSKYSQRLEEHIDRMLEVLEAEETKPWFNHFLFEKYLQSLEALAAETGGRAKQLNIKQLPPDEYAGIDPDDEGSES